MNKRELAQILRPLIKECIKEVIFEEGVLSQMITEVVVGLKDTETLVESRKPQVAETRSNNIADRESKKLQETKRKMLNAIGSDAYSGVDLFEGTTPLSSGGTPNASPGPSSPLSGVDPSDRGVDITKLFPNAPALWKKLM